jgi:hypothetical protein
MRSALVSLLPDTRTGTIRIVSTSSPSGPEPIKLPEAA